MRLPVEGRPAIAKKSGADDAAATPYRGDVAQRQVIALRDRRVLKLREALHVGDYHPGKEGVADRVDRKTGGVDRRCRAVLEAAPAPEAAPAAAGAAAPSPSAGVNRAGPR